MSMAQKNVHPKDYESSKQLAQCFITKLADQVKLPPEIHASLKDLGKNLVGVIPGESKKVIFFLTQASQILMVRLFLNKDQLNETFFSSLKSALNELGMSNLFSTGICFKAEICVWEGVFEFDNESNFDKIQARLAKVSHVNRSKFEKFRLIE
jgi:hypothetical protein